MPFGPRGTLGRDIIIPTLEVRKLRLRESQAKVSLSPLSSACPAHRGDTPPSPSARELLHLSLFLLKLLWLLLGCPHLVLGSRSCSLSPQTAVSFLCQFRLFVRHRNQTQTQVSRKPTPKTKKIQGDMCGQSSWPEATRHHHSPCLLSPGPRASASVPGAPAGAGFS